MAEDMINVTSNIDSSITKTNLDNLKNNNTESGFSDYDKTHLQFLSEKAKAFQSVTEKTLIELGLYNSTIDKSANTEILNALNSYYDTYSEYETKSKELLDNSVVRDDSIVFDGYSETKNRLDNEFKNFLEPEIKQLVKFIHTIFAKQKVVGKEEKQRVSKKYGAEKHTQKPVQNSKRYTNVQDVYTQFEQEHNHKTQQTDDRKDNVKQSSKQKTKTDDVESNTKTSNTKDESKAFVSGDNVEDTPKSKKPQAIQVKEKLDNQKVQQKRKVRTSRIEVHNLQLMYNKGLSDALTYVCYRQPFLQRISKNINKTLAYVGVNIKNVVGNIATFINNHIIKSALDGISNTIAFVICHPLLASGLLAIAYFSRNYIYRFLGNTIIKPIRNIFRFIGKQIGNVFSMIDKDGTISNGASIISSQISESITNFKNGTMEKYSPVIDKAIVATNNIVYDINKCMLNVKKMFYKFSVLARSWIGNSIIGGVGTILGGYRDVGKRYAQKAVLTTLSRYSSVAKSALSQVAKVGGKTIPLVGVVIAIAEIITRFFWNRTQAKKDFEELEKISNEILYNELNHRRKAESHRKRKRDLLSSEIYRTKFPFPKVKMHGKPSSLAPAITREHFGTNLKNSNISDLPIIKNQNKSIYSTPDKNKTLFDIARNISLDKSHSTAQQEAIKNNITTIVNNVNSFGDYSKNINDKANKSFVNDFLQLDTAIKNIDSNNFDDKIKSVYGDSGYNKMQTQSNPQAFGIASLLKSYLASYLSNIYNRSLFPIGIDYLRETIKYDNLYSRISSVAKSLDIKESLISFDKVLKIIKYSSKGVFDHSIKSYVDNIDDMYEQLLKNKGMYEKNDAFKFLDYSNTRSYLKEIIEMLNLGSRMGNVSEADILNQKIKYKDIFLLWKILKFQESKKELDDKISSAKHPIIQNMNSALNFFNMMSVFYESQMSKTHIYQTFLQKRLLESGGNLSIEERSEAQSRLNQLQDSHGVYKKSYTSFVTKFINKFNDGSLLTDTSVLSIFNSYAGKNGFLTLFNDNTKEDEVTKILKKIGETFGIDSTILTTTIKKYALGSSQYLDSNTISFDNFLLGFRNQALGMSSSTESEVIDKKGNIDIDKILSLKSMNIFDTTEISESRDILYKGLLTEMLQDAAKSSGFNIFNDGVLDKRLENVIKNTEIYNDALDVLVSIDKDKDNVIGILDSIKENDELIRPIVTVLYLSNKAKLHELIIKNSIQTNSIIYQEFMRLKSEDKGYIGNSNARMQRESGYTTPEDMMKKNSMSKKHY